MVAYPAPVTRGEALPPRARTRGLAAAAALAVAMLAGCADQVMDPPAETSPLPVLGFSGVETLEATWNEALQWNRTALEAVTHGTLGPPMVARALAVVHTAMFDAWAAYDEVAVGTRLGEPGSGERFADRRRSAPWKTRSRRSAMRPTGRWWTCFRRRLLASMPGWRNWGSIQETSRRT